MKLKLGMNCSKLGANGLRYELTWVRNDCKPQEALACLFVPLKMIILSSTTEWFWKSNRDFKDNKLKWKKWNTVPLKIKLTVPRVSILETRDLILDILKPF